ncbi:FxDxF family PEP-CTERM protein [Massilia sp. YMA4]|uniref:FxDxF family PEP-CTERM protein n=1 Tax=Massilia sp. YMA4 TaxID=1593482 RepID=UPI001877F2E3|nr:FxDxF family PEP-CTERM protein [Massilia sp. YMA4]
MQLLSRALCAAAILAATGSAQAFEPLIETTGFTLGTNASEPVPGIALIGETANSASFSLYGITEGFPLSVDSAYKPFASDYRFWQNEYEIGVKAGYKITGITLTGSFYGALAPAQWTMPGDAGNDLGFGFGTYHTEHPLESNWATAKDLNGRKDFSLTLGKTALEGEFTVSFNGRNEVTAESVWYLDELSNEQYWLGSSASAGLGQLTMTVNIAAVPEPQTWAMLLGGLALAGAVARRRRQDA